MTSIKLIPDEFKEQLSVAIDRGESDIIKKMVEENNLDVDSYLDSESYTPIIMEVLLSYGYKNDDDRLTMLRYLLEKGANPNMYCKSRYNSLHIAVQQEGLVSFLDLFLDYKGDVNLPDNNGATIAYWAIQGFPWRKEGEEREIHLSVVEKIMMLGANMDYENKYGITPRQWLENTSEDVQQLVEKCENLEPTYKPSGITMPSFK